MVTREFFGAKVHLFFKIHKKQIYTDFLGRIYVFAYLTRNKNLSKETLKFAILHEQFHQKHQRFVLTIPLSITILLILIKSYLAAIIFSLVLWLFVILILHILMFKLEELADLYAAKILGKDASKKAILDLYKRRIIVEDKVHGTIRDRIARLDR